MQSGYDPEYGWDRSLFPESGDPICRESADEEHVVEAVLLFKVVLAPIEFHPVGVAFIEENAQAGFDGLFPVILGDLEPNEGSASHCAWSCSVARR